MSIYKKILEFQKQCPPIIKNSKGYNYVYADMTTVLDAVNPILHKLGLVVMQPINGRTIKTIICDTESGESIESNTDIPCIIFDRIKVTAKSGDETEKTAVVGFEGMSLGQAEGSMITYFRRYALCSLLGVVSEKDTDASRQKADDKKVQQKASDKKTVEFGDETYKLIVSGCVKSNKLYSIDDMRMKFNISNDVYKKLSKEVSDALH